MPKPKKRRRNSLIIAALLLLAAGGWAGFHFFHKSDDTITVQVEKVTRRDLTETVVANGKIQPVTQVMISPEVAGEIIELPVKEGQAESRPSRKRNWRRKSASCAPSSVRRPRT